MRVLIGTSLDAVLRRINRLIVFAKIHIYRAEICERQSNLWRGRRGLVEFIGGLLVFRLLEENPTKFVMCGPIVWPFHNNVPVDPLSFYPVPRVAQCLGLVQQSFPDWRDRS